MSSNFENLIIKNILETEKIKTPMNARVHECASFALLFQLIKKIFQVWRWLQEISRTLQT